MLVKELEDLYRNQFEDTVSVKYFLSLKLFLDYLNEAEEEAAFRKNLLFDKTSSFCTIAVTSGVSTYLLNDCIYALVYASIVDANGIISVLTPTDRIEEDRIRPDWRTLTQRPDSFIQHDTSLEILPIPDAAYTLRLECYRLPLDKITSEPEIHRNHHRSLVDWVLYRAYSTPDADMQDANKAGYYLSKFTSVFGLRPSADNRRKHYANRPHRNKVCT